ncbi:transposase [Sutcliffiella cohnii]|uniref:transposase n=1 Tax=Sutcliffiella cohnii TaxID=33932 RepID=UPI002E1EC18D|nr:transposase [Sutcliffiella cohnii]MED4014472.1 transposase [Sutcliffiella cohnii]
MARKARDISKSGIYHIMLRGINQQTIFEDSEDKKRFLETLEKIKKENTYELYGYCLMDNHVHLLLKETAEPISMIMKRISSSYVYWYNNKYARCGHLFQERFKSEKVEDSKYFLVALRYIHQNPVKAGLAKNIHECKWTSLKEYIQKPRIVDTTEALSRFTLDNNNSAIDLFLAFMDQPNNDQCLEQSNLIKISDDEVRTYFRCFFRHHIQKPSIYFCY